jgi:multidrug efflux pump subunit AcrB
MEDQGMAYVSVTTPQATVERTEKVLDEVTEIAKKIEGVENVTTLAGYSIVTEIAGASYGMAMINLKDWKDRNISVNEFIAELSKKQKVFPMRRSKFSHHLQFRDLVTPVVLNFDY